MLGAVPLEPIYYSLVHFNALILMTIFLDILNHVLPTIRQKITNIGYSKFGGCMLICYFCIAIISDQIIFIVNFVWKFFFQILSP